MMKSKYVFIVTAIVIVVVVGLFAVLSSNSTATAQSSNQQGISSACCPFSQPACQVVSDGCCKSKSDPNKKSDPNCHK
jgi:hypothetical protein